MERYLDRFAGAVANRASAPGLAQAVFMADLFGCDSVSHRANADVDALCGVWRVLLVALTDLPQGLMARLRHASGCALVLSSYLLILGRAEPWFYLLSAPLVLTFSRPIAPTIGWTPTNYRSSRCRVVRRLRQNYAPGGLVNRMYPAYEPRVMSIAMALEVRDALVTGTHRVIEAGTGVGKSMAYLVPFAEAARRNNITVGIATKSNNLADQLMYHELPKLAEQLDGGLSFCALKGMTTIRACASSSA